MYEQALLAEQFGKLLAQAEQAEQMYAGIAAETDDPDLREQFQELLREKRRHVQMTERLIEIVD